MKYRSTGWALFVLIPLAGCGSSLPQPVPVAGRILLDGKPLGGGFIRVIPAEYRPADSPIDAAGNFRLSTSQSHDGCVPGTHAVEIAWFESRDRGNIRKWLIPRHYSSRATSGLSITIQEPTENVVIELKSNNEPLPVEVLGKSSNGQGGFEGVQ